MLKFLGLFLLSLIFFVFTTSVFAAGNNFVTIVNPIRGSDFWDLNEKPEEAVLGQIEILKDLNVPATWLLRFDALKNLPILQTLETSSVNDEKGLFLEVTPTLTDAAGVAYRKSAVWHLAGSVFLTGYSIQEREKLIDTAFLGFKEVFGSYPQSVGAWYIDSFSLDYMQKKYNINAALIVADQYSTDNYQIWGQYWAAPYYPTKTNTLSPAQNTKDKIPVVVMQWAARDPVNGYGQGVEESTYSVQANDYMDYHDLTTDYFSKLVDTLTLQRWNKVNQIVVGLENSYSWEKYGSEYQNQIKTLAEKRDMGQLSTTTMKSFSSFYKTTFPQISPEHLIVAKDPLGSEKETVWFMNPYYRAGWFADREGSIFRDIRQYVTGNEEPCLKNPCEKVNFATFATRVLDDVTYKQNLKLDIGKIKNIDFQKGRDGWILQYLNEAGNRREVNFMFRDIAIDGKVQSIDSFILEVITSQKNVPPNQVEVSPKRAEIYQETIFGFIFKIIKFLFSWLLLFLIPGYLLVRSLKQSSLVFNLFLSTCLGFVLLTLITFILGYLKLTWLVYLYVGGALTFFFLKKNYSDLTRQIKITHFQKGDLLLGLIIVMGVIFQSLAMARSGWVYDFGVGFWGPTGHDGIWHQALINQLIKTIPPENPAFSGTLLANYHYFYDLLVASTARISGIPVLDLLYRFFPVIFSILLGLGTYLLVELWTKKKSAILFSLYFVYFGGSFGWVVTYLKNKVLEGESTFWVNQPISFNLNPPFAVSLILMISVVLLVHYLNGAKSKVYPVLVILLTGSLIEFKVYGGLLLLGALFMVGLKQLLFERKSIFFKTFLLSLGLSLLVFLPLNGGSASLIVFSPFWFIHSMVDFPDRLGWTRLAQARVAYFERGEWIRFFLAETLAFTLFLAGNLGTRVLAFLGLGIVLKRKLWREYSQSLIVWIMVGSLIIPLLFIQKGNNWNTIQFMYYALYFFALLAGITLARGLKQLTQTTSLFIRYMGFLVIGMVVVITPINAVAVFKEGLSTYSSARLGFEELEALNFLKNLPEGTVLTYPFDRSQRSKFQAPLPLFAYETTSYVAAFSGKTTYLEDEVQQEILQNDSLKRLVESNEFFQRKKPEWSRQFLSDNNIRYIYLLKDANVSLDEKGVNLSRVFDNQEVEIYEVNR